MSKKAVYNNQYLGIYITGKDLDELLKDFVVVAPVYIGKVPADKGVVRVKLTISAHYVIKDALTAEREAVEAVRALVDAQIQD